MGFSVTSPNLLGRDPSTGCKSTLLPQGFNLSLKALSACRGTKSFDCLFQACISWLEMCYLEVATIQTGIANTVLLFDGCIGGIALLNIRIFQHIVDKMIWNQIYL